MNLEMVEEFSDKEILIQQVPLIEGPMRHQPCFRQERVRLKSYLRLMN